MNQYDFRRKVNSIPGEENRQLKHVRKIRNQAIVLIVSFLLLIGVLSYFEGLHVGIIVACMIVVYNKMESLVKSTVKWLISK